MNLTDAKEFANNIYSSSRRVYHLLENLLQWARIQTGRIYFDPITFNIKDLFENVMLLYESAILKKELKIEKDIPKEIEIYADKNMIETVIRNLFSNAIKFTPRKGKILFKAVKESSNVNISISDTGIGIKPEIQKSLFAVDKIVSTPDTDNVQGSGLGLILAKEFIEKNGGELWFHSEVNLGTTFKVSLPSQQNSSGD
jgi:signal transduction histidine kinase